VNQTQALDVIAVVFHDVAPEIDLATVDPGIDLRDGLDLDSKDFLNLMAGIHDQTGRDIPERHYGLFVTLADLTAYLVDHAGRGLPGDGGEVRQGRR